MDSGKPQQEQAVITAGPEPGARNRPGAAGAPLGRVALRPPAATRRLCGLEAVLSVLFQAPPM